MTCHFEDINSKQYTHIIDKEIHIGIREYFSIGINSMCLVFVRHQNRPKYNPRTQLKTSYIKSKLDELTQLHFYYFLTSK